MGGRIKPMNDTEILKEMIISDAQVPLQQEGLRRPSVQLTDVQSGTTVNIKGLPHDSIVIRAEDFEDPLTVFAGSKGERKRADFVIICNDTKKWIICIEIQGSNYIKRGRGYRATQRGVMFCGLLQMYWKRILVGKKIP